MFGAEQVPAGVEDVFLRQGPLGAALVVVAALAWWLIRREAARADSAQAKVDQLNLRFMDEVLPAVTTAAQQHAAVTAMLTRVGELLPDAEAAMKAYRERERERGRR